MTRTSRRFRRLGIVAAAAMAIAGLPVAAMLPVANAAHVTGIQINPPSDTAATGTCNEFTVTIDPAQAATIDVQISQNSDTTGPVAIGFCDPGPASATRINPQGAPNAGTVEQSQTTNGVVVIGQNQVAQPDTTCDASAASTTNPTVTRGVICNAEYSTNAPNVATSVRGGQVTFGVTSNQAGSMSVTAYAEEPANDSDTPEAGEQQVTAQKTWVAGGPAGVTSIACTPASDSNPEGSTHTFTCTASGASGATVANVQVLFDVVSGPNAEEQSLQACNANTNNAGQATCQYTDATGVNSPPGTDTIDIYVEQNGQVGRQAGEATTQITKTWVQAASDSSTVTLTCGGVKLTSGTNATANNDTVCQNPLTDKDETFTAKVLQGTTPVAGVIASFAITGETAPVGTEPAAEETFAGGDTATRTANCTTAADGTCTVTLNNPTVTEGETVRVTATVQRQGGTTTSDTATKVWRTPRPDEARNINLAPDTVSSATTTVQTLTATVTDRNGGPVPGVDVQFTETGPGAFRNGSSTQTVTTDAAGKASVDVQTGINETGTQTVTATINGPNPITTGAGAGQNVRTAGTNNDECESAAGQSLFTASGGNANDNTSVTVTRGAASTFTGAAAGNCADSSTVNWTAGSATPTPTGTGTPGPTGCTASAVSLTVDVPVITAGNTPKLSGTVTCSSGSPNGEVVTIYGKGYGQTAYSQVGQTAANASGAFSLTVQPFVQTVYVAQADQVQSGTGSNAVVVFPHMRVQPTSVGHLGTVDRRATTSGYILPRYTGVPVGLAFINPQGKYTFLGQANTSGGNWTVRANTLLAPGQYTFVYYTSATRGTLKGSKSLRLNVR